MESNPQMPYQPTPNQGQYPPPPYQGYPPFPQGYPQMPSLPSVQLGQYSPPPYQGYAPSPQGYPQTLPNPPYQQLNQEPMSGSQSGRPRRILRRSRGLMMMLRGVILLVGGIVLSLISYSCASSAADNGGTGYYTIFTGAVVVGAIYAIVGFFRWIMGH